MSTINTSVTFKGTGSGLVIRFEGVPDLEQLKKILVNKINSSPNFFQGATVLFQDNIGLQEPEKEELEKICRKHGLEPCGQYTNHKADAEFFPVFGLSSEELNQACRMVDQTVRSGQRICSKGHLVVLGDVNSGAFVEAEGHIIVLGALRGTAHAGVKGDRSAYIFAHHFSPDLLRIADLIARPPEDDKKNASPEKAFIHNDQILVETYIKRQQGHLAG